MEFESYAKRINSLKVTENFGQVQQEKMQQYSFLVKNHSMVLEEVKKSKFEQINDKWYSFSDDIVSHPYLKDIIGYTEKKNEKIEKYPIWEKIPLEAREKSLLEKGQAFPTWKNSPPKSKVLSDCFSEKKRKSKC